MLEQITAKPYMREITPVEQLFGSSPHAIVTMVARINGHLTENMLRDAVTKVQQRHLHLKACIIKDTNHVAWLTTDGTQDVPIEVVPRTEHNQWSDVVEAWYRVPFDFENRPPIRFILVRSEDVSELIIMCHHIICDGLSLAYLMRDVMVHLGDPSRKLEILPDLTPVGLDSMPEGVSANSIVKFFINRINKKWRKEAAHFDQQDYEALNEAYWATFHHQVALVELSEPQTSALVARCRKEGVTVNSALTTAFVGAQTAFKDALTYHLSVVIAASLRNRLRQPVGEGIGFFAGAITLDANYDVSTGFWENARKLHQKIKPSFTNKNLFKDPLTWSYLDPALLEAMNFKKLGSLVQSQSASYHKLNTFSQRNDVVSSILKREGIENPEKVFIGTAITNLGRLNFAKHYGSLELDRLMMKPGGGFPLASVNCVVGAVTCADKLSVSIAYAEETVDTQTMIQIKQHAMQWLLDT